MIDEVVMSKQEIVSVSMYHASFIIAFQFIDKLTSSALIFLARLILKNKLGFDEAFNYKEENDLDVALKRYIIFKNIKVNIDKTDINLCVCSRVDIT